MNDKQPVNLKLSDEAERRILSDTETVRADAGGMEAFWKQQRAMREEGQRVLRTQDPAALVNAIQNFCTPPAKPKP